MLHDGRMNAAQLIRLLDHKKPVSVRRIASLYGFDRQWVRQTLDQLMDAGLPCRWTSANSVRLSRSVNPLDADEIRAHVGLFSASLANRIEVFETIDSTNDYLLSKSVSAGIHRRVCIAEMMEAGRGRRRRKWYGGAFENIMLSIGWNFGAEARKISGLSLAVAVMVGHALEKFTGKSIAVKWPNDLLYQGKKLCGILIESQPSGTVIGIGINCRPPQFKSDEMKLPAIGLTQITRKRVSRNILISMLLKQLDLGLIRFQQHGFAAFRESWNLSHAFANQWMVTSDSPQVCGRAVDVDECGALMLERKDGKLVRIHSGEVTPVDE